MVANRDADAHPGPRRRGPATPTGDEPTDTPDGDGDPGLGDASIVDLETTSRTDNRAAERAVGYGEDRRRVRVNGRAYEVRVERRDG